MEERMMAQANKAATTSFTPPTLTQPTRGFGSQPTAAPPQKISEVQPSVQEIQSSSGKSLEGEAQSLKEPPRGHDFSRVRLYATESASGPIPDVNPLLLYALRQDMAVQRQWHEANISVQRDDADVSAVPNVLCQRSVQQSATTDGSAVEEDLGQRIQTAAGGGSSLDSSVQHKLEQGLGADFSKVRVHTDGEADRLSGAVNAVAFTTGQDIFFSAGSYNPGSSEGMHLLAHEAVHTVQQASGPVAGTPTLGGVTISNPSDRFEQEAEQMAVQVINTPTPDVNPQPIQRQTEEKNETTHTINTSNTHLTQQGATTIQRFGLGDIKNAASAGANWVGEQAENVADMGADAFAGIVARIAPGLADLIRNGPLGLLTEKIKEGFHCWLAGVMGNVDITSAITGLTSSFTGVLETIKGVAKGDPASCTAFAQSINSLRELGQAFMDNPVIQQLQAAFTQVSGAFKKVSDLVLAPVFDVLMDIAGGVFNQVKRLASTIWGWAGQVRNFLGAAWDWVKEQLGFGGDGEGGILNWLKTKASEVWSQTKETLSPAIEPLKKVGTVSLAFSPVGMFAIVVKFVPPLVEAVQWLWAHKDDKEIVRSAHEQMGNTILPQLLTSVQGFSQAVQTTVTSFVNQAVQLGEGVLELLGAVTGVPLLSMAQNLVQTVSNGVKELVTWGQETFQAASKGIQELFEKIRVKIEPYVGVLSSLALALVNPAMIPVILAGWAWQQLDDCYKAPIINFLIDVVIGLLEAAPSLPMFGLLWPMLKTGIIGFLKGVKNQDDAIKVAITNKLAKIVSGASPAFLLGFVKGLLQGIWEGLTDPFALIYMAIQGLSNVITWLEGVANEALVPTPADQETTSPQTAAGASATDTNNVATGQRMQQMAGELRPPVDQVTQGFMPALQEVFSGGEGMSFEQLMQKLGEAWAAVETAIMGAAGTLANKVCEFFMQDTAEGAMGESVGWFTGTIVFEVILGILTAGSWQAAEGAMKVLKLFAKILDWTGEVMGMAFKALSKVGGFILDGIKGLGKLLNNAGGASRVIMDALGEIGQKLISFADELLGLAGKAGKGEVNEVVEEGAEKAAKEAAEEGAEKGVKEGAEEGADRGAKETTDDAAKKAAELPAAIAEAKGITEVNDAVNTPVSALILMLNTTVKPKYSWIERFESRTKGMPGDYSIHMIASDNKIGDYSEGGQKTTKEATEQGAERSTKETVEEGTEQTTKQAGEQGAEVTITGTPDYPHEGTQGTRFASLEGGGNLRFLGDSSQGIEGYFTPNGSTTPIPFSLKNFSDTGRMTNLISRINRNADKILPADAGKTILHASVPQFNADDMIEFIENGPIRRMATEGKFQKLLFDCENRVVIVVDSSGVRKL